VRLPDVALSPKLPGMGTPGIFEPILFSFFRTLALSRFLRPMHPKTEIRPDPAAIEKCLRAGWVGQIKIHGHRAQIHLPADANLEPIAYTRHGTLHKKEIPVSITAELRRVIHPTKGWTVIDAEWVKGEDKLFLFDVLKKDDEDLDQLTYPERYALLPRDFISPHLVVLPCLRTLDKCLEVIQGNEDYVEGLVFKSLSSPGFSDTSILRCRKRT